MKKARIVYPLLVFFFLAGIGEISLLLFKSELSARHDRLLDSVGSTLAQSIQQQLVQAISATSTMEVMLHLSDFEMDAFDRWAVAALASNPAVAALQLAPNGVIAKIHPMQGHEGIIGHDLLSDHNRRDAAQMAIDVGRLTIIGPIVLRQNSRLALIARLPVFKPPDAESPDVKPVFWGFVIALIYPADLVDYALESIHQEHLLYSLYGNNPDSVYPPLISRTEKLPQAPLKKLEVMVANGTWILTVSYPSQELNPDVFLQLSILLVSLLAAFLVFKSREKSWQHEVELEQMNAELEKLANTDALTKLPNRRSVNLYAEQQFAISRRSNLSFSLAFLDLDLFKKLNDSYGHDVGDLALCHFSDLFSNLRRETDLLARWGGEEFILVLPLTDLQGASQVCQNMCDRLAETPLVHGGQDIKMTVSIGLATILDVDESFTAVLERADRAVYLAKQQGRNRVVRDETIYPSDPVSLDSP